MSDAPEAAPPIPKPARQSKTLWVNLLTAVAAVVAAVTEFDLPPKVAAIAVATLALVNFALRLLTNEPIKDSPGDATSAESARYRRAALFAPFLLPLLLMMGCGIGPEARKALEVQGKIDDADYAREATLRENYRDSLRLIAQYEFERRLRDRAVDGKVSVDAAEAEASVMVRQHERIDGVIDGYADEAGKTRMLKTGLRKDVAGVLHAAEERRPATEALAASAPAAAGALVALEAQKAKAREAEARAREAEAKAAAEEEE